MSERRSEFTAIRIYSNENGDSHLENLLIPLISAGDMGFLSEKFAATSVQFRHVDPGYNYDFHSSPKKQFFYWMVTFKLKHHSVYVESFRRGMFFRLWTPVEKVTA